MSEDELWQPLLDAIKRADEGLLRVSGWDEEKAIRTLRAGIRDTRLDLRRGTLQVLALLPTTETVAVIDDLLWASLAVRDAVRVRNLLGRLPYKQAWEVVPPAVWRLLKAEEEEPDGPVYDAWMRMGELLEHLGLYEALRELCDRARDHIDGDVRDVPEYFSDV